MLSWALPVSACPWGRPDPGLCPVPCAPGPALLDSRSCPAAPSAEPLPEPLRAAPGPAVRAAALRELGALSCVRRRCLLVSRGARGHPRLSGDPAPIPREPLSAREGWCSSCSSGTGLSCPGDTRPGLSPASRGAPPPWRPFVSLFLFPRLPTLIEARTLLTVAFQLVSL